MIERQDQASNAIVWLDRIAQDVSHERVGQDVRQAVHQFIRDIARVNVDGCEPERHERRTRARGWLTPRARRRRRIDLLIEHNEVDAESCELTDKGHELVRRARQASELGYHDYIDLTGADRPHESAECLPAGLRASHAMINELLEQPIPGLG